MPGWVHHIDITVSDMAASTAFYQRVMPVMDFRRIADSRPASRCGPAIGWSSA